MQLTVTMPKKDFYDLMKEGQMEWTDKDVYIGKPKTNKQLIDSNDVAVGEVAIRIKVEAVYEVSTRMILKPVEIVE